MSKSKSGLTKEQREDFLLQQGFVPLRGGKGNHEVWEHPELKQRARERRIEAPANILAHNAQKPWEITLPHDPAAGTWRGIAKHAGWCRETAAAASPEEKYREVSRQFNRARADWRRWRKGLNHAVKAGIQPPAAPVSHRELERLRKEKNRLSPQPGKA